MNVRCNETIRNVVVKNIIQRSSYGSSVSLNRQLDVFSVDLTQVHNVNQTQQRAVVNEAAARLNHGFFRNLTVTGNLSNRYQFRYIQEHTEGQRIRRTLDTTRQGHEDLI